MFHHSHILCLLLTVLLFACTNNTVEKNVADETHIPYQSEKNNSLYKAIGGQQGIEKLVNVFVKNIANDPDILPYFEKSSVKHFKQGFVEHFCGIVDGPCKYTGDSMVDIHTGMHITEKDFNRVVELLVQSMEEVNISYRNQNKILNKLASLRGQIIKI
ncbi:group 1 truncated hemoglobin [Colwellia sp. E2M01]|uniref:group I truncated hemoglobin n=1 Tax=Colwellia sp. E2M01 TaxID=2841561 RepID=UPI001C08A6E2|nr:group 1 truncated hemoglobin [Colwellia sp. E2M01]MBU2869254.1 group 1 truncated hemoglobin [Colwellia sp. E2M01]